jgi:hypothetical protein
MATSLIGIPSRLAVFLCGIVSVFVGRVLWALQGLNPAPKPALKWSLVSVVLIVVGAFDVVIASLPSSWVEKVCKFKSGAQPLSSVPLKVLGGFAIVAYLVTLGLSLAPGSWHPSPQLVYFMCPACILAITVDPSLGAVLLLLAPLNAAVYGSLGAALGYVVVLSEGYLMRDRDRTN